MEAVDFETQVEAARAYESLFVPALFGQWAPRVAELAELDSGMAVLDVACGTGALTRAVADRVAPGGRAVGLDPHRGMLAVAEEASPDLEWQQGSAESLPYGEGSFDRVVSQFGLMFFADRLGALKEMRRVTKEGGRAAVAVWDALERNPTYEAEAQLFERLAGKPAGDAVRAPFRLGDVSELEGLCGATGWKEVHVRREEGTARFLSAQSMIEADLRGWLPVMGVELGEEKIQEILKHSADVLPGDGLAAFELSALILTMRRD